ncbi:MAG: hypothetical protein PHW63_11175 [Alphaproteobacteria bacterium]|nr:hypothetical protein [Alphaproteobacteria bacterium]
MSAKKTQAGFLLLALVVGLAPCTTSAWAKVNYKARTFTSGGADGAGGNKVFSIGEIFDTVGHSVGELIPDAPEDEDEAVSPKAKASSKTAGNKKESKSSPAQESEVITAKRLEAPEQPKQEAAPPPYKVYTTPMIEPEPTESVISVYDEATGRTYSNGGVSSSAAAPSASVGSSAPVPSREDNPIDIKEPPPLPAYVKSKLPAIETMEGKKEAVGAAPVVQERESNPPLISALPKQFFPIFPLGAGAETKEQLLPIASNMPLTEDHGRTKRVILFIHDIQRNSGEGVAMLMTLAGSEEEPPLILAPQFSLDIDIVRFAQHLPNYGRTVARWPLDDPWQFGGASIIKPDPQGVSSFTALDLMLLFLTDKNRFPSLEDVVIVGHGTGADFVQRYAAVGKAPDILEKERITTRFLAANPSSYLYMTNMRPSGPTGSPFKPVDLKNCAKAASYPYGLEDLNGYAKRIGANAIRLRFPERRVTTLVAGDMITDNYLDRSCEAMAQGKDRSARGQFYGRLIQQSFGELAESTQLFKTVPKVGYDPVALFGSPCGMAVLFGSGTCK